jgi:hypothetical protein
LEILSRLRLLDGCFDSGDILVSTSLNTPTLDRLADQCWLSSFYPETKKRSLEEMAAYFGETVLIDTDLNTEHKAAPDAALREKGSTGAQHSEQIT